MININDDLYNIRDNSRDEINIFEMPINARKFYYLLYSYYTKMFLKYLKLKTTIKTSELNLMNSGLNFKSLKSDQKDFYQTICTSELDFYYIRNNLYIYRLTKEETEYLKKQMINNVEVLDLEFINFIEKTFKKVIFEKTENDNVFEINYGPIGLNFFALSNSLVLGFRYDYKNRGIDDNIWYDNYKKQQEFINNEIQSLTKNISQVLNCNCKIFQYSKYNVVTNT